jgi:hypothetical protein
MRWLIFVASFCTFVISLTADTVLAGQNISLLKRNPFDKPSELAQPRKKTATPDPDEVEDGLEITAILVSDAMPLVIATGELLSIGDSINGYHLIAVEEYKALFAKNGDLHTFFLSGSGMEIEE